MPAQKAAAKYPKIVVTPPGPKARALVGEDEQVISGSLVRFYPLAAESGHDSIVKDVDGNEYIDFNSGLVCLAVGHSHPRVMEAIKNQAEKLIASTTRGCEWPTARHTSPELKSMYSLPSTSL